MKKIMCIICIAVLCFNSSIAVFAAVDVPDVFGDGYVECDVNFDGNFNILDLVRAKKYVAGASVTVNMRFIENDLGNAQLLVSLRQALLKGDKK